MSNVSNKYIPSINAKRALELLDTAPYSDKKSAVNPNLTCAQVVDIMRKGILEQTEYISDIFQKRVWQVTLNTKRPFQTKAYKEIVGDKC